MADETGNDLRANEFTQLFLGTSSNGALPTTESSRIPKASTYTSLSATASKKKDIDVSELDAAQASQLLKKQHGRKNDRKDGGRYRRSGVVREYHKLVEDTSMEAVMNSTWKDEKGDESEAFRISSAQFNRSRKTLRPKRESEEGSKLSHSRRRDRPGTPTSSSSSGSTSSSDDSSTGRTSTARELKSSLKDSDDSSASIRRRRDRRRRQRYNCDGDSSSTSGSSIKQQYSHRRNSRGNRRGCSYSSSDDEIEKRRERARAKRKVLMKSEGPRSGSDNPKAIIQTNDSLGSQKQNDPKNSKENISKVQVEETSINNSSSSSSQSSSSSSDNDSSSDEEMAFVEKILKPTFVPKHSRLRTKQQHKLIEEGKISEKELELQQDMRARKSRAMVQEIIASESLAAGKELSHGGTQSEINETGGTTIPPPNDDDDSIDAKESMSRREMWEVRELLRILRDSETLIKQKEEETEKERRSKMNDVEKHLEDVKSGKYRRPGEQRFGRNGGHLQRYHHRGAFYMDEDTLQDKNDIRHKASMYSRSNTGEDKYDKTKLPRVMQVKKFGFAGYSTKYKGLKQEDTTWNL